VRVTTFEGFVEDGQIRLPGGVLLPEKTKVYVVVPDIEVPSPGYIGSPHLVHRQQAADFEKEIVRPRRGRI
jgi:hypothetical protein